VARALAATASRAGRKVSFFMRKGADILSKWVGEAERQLRMLFEEAQRQQPAIIFFDEIDGLAPVMALSLLPLLLLVSVIGGLLFSNQDH
jgi:SpoVK/Ycf46/Vps4 family AAA+-type ATPase